MNNSDQLLLYLLTLKLGYMNYKYVTRISKTDENYVHVILDFFRLVLSIFNTLLHFSQKFHSVHLIFH